MVVTGLWSYFRDRPADREARRVRVEDRRSAKQWANERGHAHHAKGGSEHQ